jgi:hypothetical protein
MSDTLRRPGWWLASDGRWYPPELHPSYRPLVPPQLVPALPPRPVPEWDVGRRPFSFDITRLTQTELTTCTGTVMVLVSLFLPWFTYDFGLGPLSTDGLRHSWMYVVLILGLAIVTFVVVRSGYREVPRAFPTIDSRLLLAATGINVVLCALAFLLRPGGVGFTEIGWGFGAYLGVAASLVAAIPLTVPAFRSHRR